MGRYNHLSFRDADTDRMKPDSSHEGEVARSYKQGEVRKMHG